MFDFATKKAPKPQLYQTYWRLNKDKVNEEANKRYTAYQKELADAEAEGKPQPENPRKWLSFAVEVAIEFLEHASKEEKAAVKEYHVKLGTEHVGLDLFTNLDAGLETTADADAHELQKRAMDIQLYVFSQTRYDWLLTVVQRYQWPSEGSSKHLGRDREEDWVGGDDYRGWARPRHGQADGHDVGDLEIHNDGQHIDILHQNCTGLTRAARLTSGTTLQRRPTNGVQWRRCSISS